MNLTIVRLRHKLSRWFPTLIAFLERVRFANLHLKNFSMVGWSLPLPYYLKRSILIRFAILSESKLFVETGTYLGDTPWQLRNHFDHLWTIEVYPPLAQLARQRFAKVKNVTTVEGDSEQALRNIVQSLNNPTLFWLDGHYSGESTGMGKNFCPIFSELTCIFEEMSHPFVICIDDARLFGSEVGYPTLDELAKFLKTISNPSISWIENDMIFVVPPTHKLHRNINSSPFEGIKSLF
jgi:hypothetical protein